MQYVADNYNINDSKFRLSWMQLARSHNVGARTFAELLKIFKTPQIALKNLPELAKRGGRKEGITIAPISEIEKELEMTEKFNAKLILACDRHYPELLLQIADPPPILIAKGDTGFLARHKVAIVGARQASTNGYNFALQLAHDISAKGYVIASGLAKGIDAAAHLGSIEFGTIGIIACGIDQIYPGENKNLYHMLYKQGLVLSEYKIGQLPLSRHFPQRNRVISGLCYGVVIVEAAVKSGTLITARFALEQGREVFAVPGSPFDPRYQGTNALIKQGAILVENADDVLYELETIIQRSSNICMEKKQRLLFESEGKRLPSEQELNKFREILLTKLSFSPVSLEAVLADLQIPISILDLLVLELELAGRLERRYGNSVCLIA
ncbi:DNA processing protein [Alphaproteobacteria bacterium]